MVAAVSRSLLALSCWMYLCKDVEVSMQCVIWSVPMCMDDDTNDFILIFLHDEYVSQVLVGSYRFDYWFMSILLLIERWDFWFINQLIYLVLSYICSLFFNMYYFQINFKSKWSRRQLTTFSCGSLTIECSSWR